jgi:hypothetical protein
MVDKTIKSTEGRNVTLECQGKIMLLAALVWFHHIFFLFWMFCGDMAEQKKMLMSESRFHTLPLLSHFHSHLLDFDKFLNSRKLICICQFDKIHQTFMHHFEGIPIVIDRFPLGM